MAKRRIQLDFSETSAARLDKLKSKTEASSYVEVVKNALQLYEAMIEETEAGKKLFARDEKGNQTEFRVWV